MAKEDRVKVNIYHKETDKNMWFRLDPSSLKVWHSKYRLITGKTAHKTLRLAQGS